MADDNGIDECNGEGEGGDPEIFWWEPEIFEPRHGWTLSPGFRVHAIVTVPPSFEWRCQFFYGPDKFAEMRGTPEFGAKIDFNVPHNLVRPGANFYFRLDYAKGLTWSDWVYSGDLKMAPKLPLPVITGPSSSTNRRPTFTGKGNEGAKVNVVWETDFTVVIATATVKNGLWAAPINTSIPDLIPGIYQCSAQQIVNGLASSFTLGFKVSINPPQIAITAPASPVTPRQSLEITGVYTGLPEPTFGMHSRDGQIHGSFGGTGATRTFTPDLPWALDNTVMLIQSINGNAYGSNVVRFEGQLPAPTIDQPPEGTTHLATVVVGGTCIEGATVAIKDVEGAVNVVGTTWTFKYDWPPGKKTVFAVQTVSGVSSAVSLARSFKIKAPKPAITPPTSPVSPRQALGITGVYPGSPAPTFKMFYWDGRAFSEKPGSFSSAGATRTFTPDQPWASKNMVKLIQTVNEVDSDPSDVISFDMKLPAPTIDQPREGTTHLATVVVGGTCVEGATVAIKDVEGAVYMGRTTWIFKYDWQPGPKLVRAVQTVDGVSSDLSIARSFKIKASPPAITSLTSPVEPRQALQITGIYSGSPAPTLIIRYWDGRAYSEKPGSFSSAGATRTFTPDQPWASKNTVWAFQTVNGVESDPSGPVDFSMKPPAPTIDQPEEGTTHLATLIVSGTCIEGATVIIRDIDRLANVAGTRWTCEYDWQPGRQLIDAVQVVSDVGSEESPARTFKIKAPQPDITPPVFPLPPRGALRITGVYSGSSKPSFKMRRSSGTEFVDVPGEFSGTGTDRSFTPDSPWQSTNTVYVQQSVDGVDSDPSDECTFTVGEVVSPQVPQFELPMAGAKTSTRPTITVVGQPGATLTVRHEGAETLHSDKANDEGVLEFVVKAPLSPGMNALQVKQTVDGVDSEWSEAHHFTVKQVPRTPTIDAPTQGSVQPRKPVIRGKGETRGQISLRRQDEPDNLIDTIKGVAAWRIPAKESWKLGNHSIQVMQEDEGDSSEWTSVPVTFEVVDALYGIGDATPALGNPVVGTEQSVMLRVQVIDGVTGEAVEGVNVQWRVNGKQGVIATTVTDRHGWALYPYKPDTAGKTEALADIPNDNDDVVMTQLYEINALATDDWAQEAGLYLDGKRVDLAEGDLVLPGGRVEAYKLELKVNSGSTLIGTHVTLQDLWCATDRGLTFFPDLGTPQVIKEGQAAFWNIFVEKGRSGIFGLNLTSSVLHGWQLPGCVEGEDPAEILDVYLDNFAQVFNGEPAYPCLGATHTFTVRPKLHSPLLGQNVTLELSQEAENLGVTVSPTTPRKMGEEGMSWSLNCANSISRGSFEVWLTASESDGEPLEMPMSLGHNKVAITERFGPRWEGASGQWTSGIRVTSIFNGHPASGITVSLVFSGGRTLQRQAAQDGWLYISYSEDSVTFNVHSPYDDSVVS
ncbi:hypothetical protein PS718_03794 [Pseudomonas fluorescens]|uniref:Uncharacterized protein n=1 Tax=Pseudomonas fluorescens TaxID=294 RepID=A0A5E7DDZ9_PSEFL|nr:hypothetical protein [Pseudomonas fluorescens]VVO15647.1 hypothetical protein PS718_03794 [Pseudomonas fluorescens]